MMHRLVIIVCVIVLNSFKLVRSEDEYAEFGALNPENFLNLLADQNYSRHLMPQWQQKKPVKLQMHIYAYDIGEFNLVDETYMMLAFVQQRWHDSRLQHDYDYAFSIYDPDIVKMIWQPDLFWANTKTLSFGSNDMMKNINLKVFPNGSVIHTARVNFVLTCVQDLHDYPMDEQRCNVKVTTFTTARSMIDLVWKESAGVEIRHGTFTAELDVQSFEAKTCVTDETLDRLIMGVDDVENFTQTDASNCIYAELLMTRRLSYHITETYIPSIFVVVASWIGFWVDPLAVPGRVTLSCTMLIALATQYAATRVGLPHVSYWKAMDYWFVICIFFAMASLLEFALANTFARQREKMQILLKRSSAELLTEGPKRKADYSSDTTRFRTTQSYDPELGSITGRRRLRSRILSGVRRIFPHRAALEIHLNAQIREERFRNRASKIDKASRILFPVVFALVNLIYWSVYLSRYYKHQ